MCQTFGCTICNTTGTSTLAHLLPHVTLRRFCSARLRPGLNFGSAPAHPAHPADRTRGGAKTHSTNCSTFNEGPPKQGQKFPKMGPLHIHNLCLPKLHPGLCLVCQSTRKFPFSLCVICLTLRVRCAWPAKVPANSRVPPTSLFSPSLAPVPPVAALTIAYWYHLRPTSKRYSSYSPFK